MPVWHQGREFLLIDIHAHEVGEPPNSPHVSIRIPDMQNTRPIRAMYMVTTPCNVGRLRSLASRVMRCRSDCFDFVDPEDHHSTYLDFSPVPGVMEVLPKGNAIILMAELFSLQVNVYVVSCQQSFDLRVNQYETHAALTMRIAGITGIPVQEVCITDHTGARWVLEEDIERTANIRVEHIMRGGMHIPAGSRSRSPVRAREDPLVITPTEPYVPHAENMEEQTNENDIEETHESHEQPLAADLGDTPTRPAPQSPSEASVSIYPMSSVRDSRVRARALPASPTPAQQEVARPVYTSLEYIGRVKAHPDCRIEDVVEELQRKLVIHGPIRPDPRNATTWRDTDWLLFPPRTCIPLMSYSLLVRNIWEQFQDMRRVPVMSEGRLMTHVVLPQSVSLAEAEKRCERWAGWKYAVILVALGSYSWILHIRRHAEILITSYLTMRAAQGIPNHEEDENSDELHEQDIEDMRRYLRGGARGRMDHRSMMITWARDRIDKEAPEYAGPTSDMILKAEARVVGALLNARSPAQVKDVISSAWRRANLQAPIASRPKGAMTRVKERAQHATITAISTAPMLSTSQQQQTSMPTQEVSPTHFVHDQDLGVMIAAHSRVLAQVVDMIALLATKQDMSVVQVGMQNVKASLHQVSETLTSLETRMQSWETNILPHILDRLPSGIPPSSISTTILTPRRCLVTEQSGMGEGEKEQVQEQKCDALDDKGHVSIASSPPSTIPMTPPPESGEGTQRNLLLELQERSLRAQARKVVQGPLKPFGGPRE